MNTTPATPIEAITAALAAHPESGAAELAEAVGISGSTASKHLAALERDGVAVRHPGTHEGARRVADRWALADTVASTQPGIEVVPANEDAIGPSALGKALGRSSGAVGNACQRLESSGSLRLVSDSPRRYQIADA